MKKKILSLVLGGAMLAASVFAFAGCNNGNKHNYTVIYKHADCDDEGYTLHICTDCGYQYADEFIAPYGHSLRTYYHADADEEAEVAIMSLSRFTEEEDLLLQKLRELTDKVNDIILTPEEMARDAAFFGRVCPHDACEFCGYVSPETEGSIEMSEAMRRLMESEKRIMEIVSMEPYSPPSILLTPLKPFEPHTVFRIPTFDENGQVKTKIKDNEFDRDISGVEAEYNKFDLLIHDDITEIGRSAFGTPTKLQRVYLPKKLEIIGSQVFVNARFEYIIIPKTLKEVGHGAFQNCYNLRTVYYAGTEEEWNRINIVGGMNMYLKDATRYYYSEERPTKAGNYWHYVYEEPTVW